MIKRKILTESELLKKGLMTVKKIDTFDRENLEEYKTFDPEAKFTPVFKGKLLPQLPDVVIQDDGQPLMEVHKDYCALPTGVEDFMEVQRKIDEDHLKNISDPRRFRWDKVNRPLIHIRKYVNQFGELIGYRIFVINGQHTGHAYGVNGLNIKALPENIDPNCLYAKVGALEEGSLSLTFMFHNEGFKIVSKDHKIFNYLNLLVEDGWCDSEIMTDDEKLEAGLAIGLFKYLRQEKGITPVSIAHLDTVDNPSFFGLKNLVEFFKTDAASVKKLIKQENEERFGHQNVTLQEVIEETLVRARYILDVLFGAYGVDSFLYRKNDKENIAGAKEAHANLVRVFNRLLNSNKSIKSGGNKLDDRRSYHKSFYIEALKAGKFYSKLGHVNDFHGIDGLRKLIKHDGELSPLNTKRVTGGAQVALMFAMERMIFTYQNKGHLHTIPTLEQYEKQSAEMKSKSKKAKSRKKSSRTLF